MLRSSNTDQLADELLIHHLSQTFDKALESDNDERLMDAFMQVAAYFVLTESLNHKLFRNLVWTPIRRFSASTMRMCIASWNWILVARDDLQVHVSFFGNFET